MGSGRLRIQLWSDPSIVASRADAEQRAATCLSVGQEGGGQVDTSSETFEDEGSQLATPPI